MKVLKFGASAVSSLEGLNRLKEIVENHHNRMTIVVVSALNGVTDELIRIAEMASRGDGEYQAGLTRVAEQHIDLLDVLPEGLKQELLPLLMPKIEELTNIYKGIFLVRDLSSKTLSTVMSYGEILASLIVRTCLTGSSYVDAKAIIKTVKQDKKNVVDFIETNKRIEQSFTLTDRVYVTEGFIATDKETGEVTHLGRGGCDYTASIIAASIRADMLEIWTDAPGFMTADPDVIDSAYVIEHLTFVEAMELCNFGVKVIFPPSIYPVYHKNIPISIRNFKDLKAKGTLISNQQVATPVHKPIKGISSITDTCLITVRGLGMVGVVGVNYRIFKALADSGISVFFVSQTASENNTSIAVKTECAERAAEVLRETFAKEMAIGEISEVVVDRHLATVAIVGEQMRHTPGIAGKLFDTLGRNGINVIASAQGASEMNISFVIRDQHLRKAINVIHDSFFLSDYQVLNLFISGVGLVGRHLISQIKHQQESLMKNNQLRIRVVGLSNSRRMVINHNGIDLDNYEQELTNSETVSSPERISVEMIRMNTVNSVFVDCTASPLVAGCYDTLLQHNINIVTANKIAASSEYDNYMMLKNTARKKGVKFLFETNVGAGLPIINTINSLIHSGDKILRIEAVVSGTLNYIFNALAEDVPLSKAIEMAQEAGYAEPDPRLDLNGSDVIRKLVILAREAGYKLNQEDVLKKLFIPDRFFEGTLEEFWKAVPELDAEFEMRRKRLASEGKKQRFVASFIDGKAEVCLREVDQNDPFYELEGSNNVILLTTERYKDYPMQIKGYGAGAAVTAAGVFADIISIANIR